LVRPASIVDEERSEPEAEKQEIKTAATSVATATSAEKEQPAQQEKVASTAPKGSAAARLAAQRLAKQKAQQRNAAALITPEHFSYVQRDLITVAVLAVLMIAIILVSYYVLVVRA
ncbi:MAG: hypothetical protein J2P36_33950, partial [Ktedonobacteraceae bacterium]|nr:hypothetical protein [Ktedonobacteraceae bacterium]